MSEEKPEKKKLDLNRRSMPKQAPWERIKNFEEVALGYAVETAVEEASRCLQCKKPLCNQGCPVGIDIRGFIKCIIDRDFSEASILHDLNKGLLKRREEDMPWTRFFLKGKTNH